MSKGLPMMTVALAAAALLVPALAFAQAPPPPPGMPQAPAQAPAAAPGAPTLPPLPSLITATPEEGYALAVRLARRAVVMTQPDGPTRGRLRPDYANEAAGVIAAAHVVAIHFQTVAAANNYWRR